MKYFLYNFSMEKWREFLKKHQIVRGTTYWHLLFWLRNTLRFEIIYRLLMILIIHPSINLLLNYYISYTSYHSSLTNFTIFSAFLTPFGIIVVLIITIVALLTIVFELLTLVAMTYCMLHKIEYTTSSLYHTTFSQLKTMRHPSAVLAVIYFIGLLPLTHIGYISSYLTTLQIPRFITSELTLTAHGQIAVILFFLLVFVLYGACAFVPLYLFENTTTFWKACKKSIQTLYHMKHKQHFLLFLLILSCVFFNLILLQILPVPVLKNSDFNIYLFRYFFHSYHFRVQLAITILFWFFLYMISMYFFVSIISLFERSQDDWAIQIKEETHPFFAHRLSAKLKRSARAIGSHLYERLSLFSHRWMLIWLLCPLMILLMILYLDQSPLMHVPWVIGHRGDSSAAENSLKGIQAAYLHGADYAEIDIQLTKDQQLVVFHDSTTARLSNQSLSIKEHTLDQLQQVELVSRNQHYTMPSLQEAITTAKECDSSFGLLIELKPTQGEEKEMVRALIKTIEENDFEDQAIFMSMDYTAVSYLQQLRPDWWIGYCIFGSLGKVEQDLNVDFLAIEESLVNTRFLEQARKNGIPVYIWTVDDYYSVLNYLRMGVSGVIGDQVEEIQEARDAYLRYDKENYVYEGKGYPH